MTLPATLTDILSVMVQRAFRPADHLISCMLSGLHPVRIVAGEAWAIQGKNDDFARAADHH
jgi:hypothetical protein